MMKISEELLDRIAQRLKAMGNPTRLRILHALEDGELSVNEIVTAVDGSQANVSKHLNVLRSADLVDRRRDGIAVYYRMSDRAVLTICRTVCDSLHLQVNRDLERIEAGRAFLSRAESRS